MTEYLRRRAEDLLSQASEHSLLADIDDINKLHHELAVHQAELELQNEELHHTQLSLQRVHGRYVELYEHAPVGYVLLDAAGIIRHTNATWRAMLNRPDDDFRGIPFTETLMEDDARIFLSRFRSLFHNPADKHIELQIKRHQTKPFYAHITAKRTTSEDTENDNNELMIIVSDISERKQAEIYRDIGREILQILNEPNNLKESIQRVLTTLKTRTKVDAVGLRLLEGEDFPYFAQDGFPADFLQTENTLLERSNDGGVCRDKDGKVCLECTCGLVISGKTDPANPLFTKGGSCWTNNSFPLLDLPSNQDPRVHPRNNCIHQGYASVALIPVRTKERIVGLIQLNDKRQDRFTLEIIEMLEDIAAHVGSALMRKQAEEALRESEFRWKFAIEGSGDGLWDWNVPQSTVFFSQRWKEMLGFSEQEIGSSLDEWSKRVHPEDLAQVMAEVQLHLDGKTPIYSNEHRVGCKDGRWKWILDRGLVVERDAANQPLRVIGTHTDITERKQAQEAVNSLLSRFKLLAEHLPGFVYQYQLLPDGTSAFPYASPGIKAIYGLSPEDAARDAGRVFAVLHPDDLSRVGASIQHSADTLTLWQDSYRVLHPDGRLLWIESHATPIRQPDGSTLWHGYIQDITERQKIEEALRSSDAYQRQILQTTADGFWMLDSKGHLVEVNNAYCAMSGYSREELLDMVINDLEAEEKPTDTRKRIKRIIRDGSETFETTHRRKDGSVFPVEISTSYIKEQGGQFICFCRDMTERKQAQLALEKKNQEMEQFVYSVSHDLKSPLVTVKTFAGMLRQDLQGGDQQPINDDLNYIERGADKMQHLLDALLQYSRIGTGDVPAQNLSADQQVQDCLASLAGILQQYHVQVSLSELPHQLHGDPLHFGQIWQNLIENAVKYRGDQPHPHIEIGATQEGHEVVFYVRDNGMGIAPEHRERIFNLFSQLNAGSEGSGLGLALVKKIVTIYQGRIWVESAGEGQGSCFKFTLPGALVKDDTAI